MHSTFVIRNFFQIQNRVAHTARRVAAAAALLASVSRGAVVDPHQAELLTSYGKR